MPYFWLRSERRGEVWVYDVVETPRCETHPLQPRLGVKSIMDETRTIGERTLYRKEAALGEFWSRDGAVPTRPSVPQLTWTTADDGGNDRDLPMR